MSVALRSFVCGSLLRIGQGDLVLPLFRPFSGEGVHDSDAVHNGVLR